MDFTPRAAGRLSGVTVRRYGQTIILEPREPRAGSAISVAPSFWSGLVAAVDSLRERAALGTRGEAALAMHRAGIALRRRSSPPSAPRA
jgi:hypothetical protein